MSRKWVLPLILLITICISVGCKYSDDNGWSGNLEQTVGVTGTYWITFTPNGALVSFTFTQMENTVEAVDNLGNIYNGSATQDLVVAENSPNEAGGTTTIVYYARTISVAISGTFANGVVVNMILTPMYAAGRSALYLDESNMYALPRGLQGEYSDSSGVSGYIEMWKYTIDPFTVTTT